VSWTAWRRELALVVDDCDESGGSEAVERFLGAKRL
jgi:hypothetical protein